jgi:Ribbon-helix-helix protein, copG family
VKKPSRQLSYERRNPELHTGRITLYLGPELKAEVIDAAKERGNSVSGIVRVLLKKWVKTGKI